MAFYVKLDELRNTNKFLDVSLTASQIFHLRKKIPYLTSYLLSLRERLEPEIKESLITKNKQPLLNFFPKGCCLEISEVLFDYAIRDKSSPLFKLQKEGFVVKKVYGILRDEVFQNAFQVGNLLADVSHDTHSKGKHPIHIAPYSNVNFKEIDSYLNLFKIMETYWGAEIYPNHFAPQISLVFPYVIKSKGNIKFSQLHIPGILSSEVLTDFDMTTKFLFNSSYSSKKLDPIDLAYLTKRLELTSKKINYTNPILREFFPNLKITSEQDFKKGFDELKDKRFAFSSKELFDSLMFDYSSKIYLNYHRGVK